MIEGALVIDAPGSPDTVRDALAKTFQTPLRECDADNRDLESTFFCYGVESREGHLMGKIARHTEEDQSVRMGSCHQVATFFKYSSTTSPQFKNYFARCLPIDLNSRRRFGVVLG